MSRFITAGLAALALAGCAASGPGTPPAGFGLSPAQIAQIEAFNASLNGAIATGCHAATALEAADPAMVPGGKSGAKIQAGATLVCTVNGALTPIVAPQPAPLVPAGTTLSPG